MVDFRALTPNPLRSYAAQVLAVSTGERRVLSIFIVRLFIDLFAFRALVIAGKLEGSNLPILKRWYFSLL